MGLVGFEGWLHTCVKAFRHIDSAGMSADVSLSGFVVAVIISMAQSVIKRHLFCLLAM